MGQVGSQGDLILHRSEWKRNGKSVVFAHGAFDLLHPGHVRLLEQARELGSLLVVAVVSDAALRELHSKQADARSDVERPITPAAERMEILAALAAVDYVVEYDAPTPAKLVSALDPEIIVEGAAGGDPAKIGSAPARKIHRIPLEPGYSTTRLIQRIQQLRA